MREAVVAIPGFEQNTRGIKLLWPVWTIFHGAI
jgi:hypothetical protein